MTRKHFENIARQIRIDVENGNTPRDRAVYAANLFAGIAKQDNPAFDYDRFLSACGLADAQNAGVR